MKIPVITVDGPSGVGKGVLCRAIAKKLNWHILDSGAVYRALVLSAINHRISLKHEQKLAALAANFDIDFMINANKLNILIKGEKNKQDIRNEAIGELASDIAVLPKVREVLLYRQRSFKKLPGLIADGRDMGTVVFPNAIIKFFLDASFEERKKRRILQLQKMGFDVNLNKLITRIKKRDDRDCNRLISPLVPAVDALRIDSTNLSVYELTNRILTHIAQFL